MRIAVAGATGRVGHHVVEVLEERGHQPVPISRSSGVDVITAAGLAEALDGVDAAIDVATGPSPEEQPATAFFTTAARNLQTLGAAAGLKSIVTVSIIGCDRFTGGYGVAKVAHEQATLAGPVPGVILRAAQFHQFVLQLVEWGRQGDVAYVPEMRIQPVAARAVAELLVELGTSPEPSNGSVREIAGPREESVVDLARLLVAEQGGSLRVEGVSDADDPDRDVYTSGALLPGPQATLAGPTFADWLAASR